MRREYQRSWRVAWSATMVFAALTGYAPKVLAATLYVSQSSANPMPPYSSLGTAAHDIQDAVDASQDGDTVLVAPGDYGLSNQVTVTKAIVLQSTSGPSQTFLTAENYIWCLWISNSLAVADGFSLRSEATYGKGIFLVGGMVRNCNFTNFVPFSPASSVVMSGGTLSNSIVSYRRLADSSQSAIYCSDGGLITDCQILGQRMGQDGRGVTLVNSKLQNSVVSGVIFIGNASGPAVYAISSTIFGCTIANNWSLDDGGGAHLEGSLMDRCIVSGNFGGAGPGGGGIFEANSIIRNSLIVSNRAVIGAAEPDTGAVGGGVYMRGGALLNCIVSKNSAEEFPNARGAGGGVFAQSGGVTNCIIYFNTLEAGSASSNWFNAGTATLDHCCTTPDPGGGGNITQDPQFVDLTNGDFHLTSTSPCIDAGIVQPWMVGAFDLDGNPRISDGSVDIGAYEKISATPQELIESLIADVNALIAQGTLRQGSGKALLASLEVALRSLNRGNTRATCGQVGAFINKTQEITRNGKLSEADGQALISTARDLRAALGCRSK